MAGKVSTMRKGYEAKKNVLTILIASVIRHGGNVVLADGLARRSLAHEVQLKPVSKRRLLLRLAERNWTHPEKGEFLLQLSVHCSFHRLAEQDGHADQTLQERSISTRMPVSRGSWLRVAKSPWGKLSTRGDAAKVKRSTRRSWCSAVKWFCKKADGALERARRCRAHEIKTFFPLSTRGKGFVRVWVALWCCGRRGEGSRRRGRRDAGGDFGGGGGAHRRQEGTCQLAEPPPTAPCQTLCLARAAKPG